MDYNILLNTYSANGELDKFQSLLNSNELFKDLNLDPYCRKACENGHLNIVKFINSNSGKILINSALHGQKHIVEYLLNTNIYTYNHLRTAFINACISGDLDTVKLLYRKSYEILPDDVLLIINSKNHFHIIKWLYEKNQFQNITVNNYQIIKNLCSDKDNFEVFEWFITNYPKLFPDIIGDYDDHLMYHCCESGNDRKIFYAGAKWHNNQCNKQKIFTILCKNNYCKTINKRSIDEHMTPGIVNAICESGATDMLKHIYRNTSMINENHFHIACINGHIDMVKFLRENLYFLVTEQTLSIVCYNDKIDILKLLHDYYGSHFTWAVNMVKVLHNCSLELIKYCLEHVDYNDMTELFNIALYRSEYDIVLWLSDNYNIDKDRVIYDGDDEEIVIHLYNMGVCQLHKLINKGNIVAMNNNINHENTMYNAIKYDYLSFVKTNITKDWVDNHFIHLFEEGIINKTSTWIYENYNLSYGSLTIPIFKGPDSQFYEWAYDNNFIDKEKLLTCALTNNNKELATKYIDDVSDHNINIILGYCVTSHINDIINWICDHRHMKFEDYYTIVTISFVYNNLSTFIHYYDKIPEVAKPEIFEQLIKCNRVNFLEWLLSIDEKIDFDLKHLGYACDNEYWSLGNLIVQNSSDLMMHYVGNNIMFFKLKGMIMIHNTNDKSLIPDEDCEICYNDKKDCITNCGHSYCYKCIQNHITQNTLTCPVCRTNVEKITVYKENNN